MEASYPHERPYFQPNSSPRVSTDPQASSKKSHLHGLHHHPHRHHHHRNSRHAKDVVQSAVQLHPPTSFGDLLKQASRSKDSKESKDNSPSHSRRESTVNGVQDEEAKAPPPKPVRPEDVARERAIVKAREKELRSSLQTLSDQSLRTSRQLDDTYYSILEKISVLRQTIGNLQELSGLTKELHENFQSDAKELVDEIQGQVEGFNNFEAQEGQIGLLEERIKSGKEKADTLTARLEQARKRVEARAKSEAEREERGNRRLRVLWGILAAIAGLILVAILFQQLRPTHVSKVPKHALNFELRDKLVDAPIPEDAKDAIVKPLAARSSKSVAPPPSNIPDLKDDPRLRIFDEL